LGTIPIEKQTDPEGDTTPFAFVLSGEGIGESFNFVFEDDEPNREVH
jgi:hypothetical protein